MWFQKEIFNYEEKKENRVKLEHWNCLVNIFIMTIETNHLKTLNQSSKWYRKQRHDSVAIETHVVVLHLELFWHLLLFQIHHYQPRGPIKSKGCCAKVKCKIWMDHYKYDTNLWCFQTWVILCIQFSFILRLKGLIKENKDKTSSFASCHDIHSATFLSNTIKFGFITIYGRRKKTE